MKAIKVNMLLVELRIIIILIWLHRSFTRLYELNKME